MHTNKSKYIETHTFIPGAAPRF